MTTLTTKTEPFRLGLDLDGVLCHFTGGFLKALEHVTGRPAPDGYVQQTWSDWADYRASEVSLAWEHTKTPYWWERLAPLDHADMTVKRFLGALWLYPDQLEVTFITTRPAVDARTQSILWLLRHGMASPQVLVARNATGKADLCRALKLDAFVDDYWQNLQAIGLSNVATDGLGTRPVLFCQPWNQSHRTTFKCVEGLPDLLMLIEDWAGLPSFTKPLPAPQAR